MQIDRNVSEWLVSRHGSISVCVSVENGEVKYAKLNGIQGCSIHIGESVVAKLHDLRDSLTEALEEIQASMLRTEPDND